LNEFEDTEVLLKQALLERNSANFRSLINDGVSSSDIEGMYGGNILHAMAGRMKAEDLVPVLRQRGIDLNEKDVKGNTPLNYSILVGDLKLASQLIKEGADLNESNYQGMTPLHLVAYYNDLTISKELLQRNADVNYPGADLYTPLHIAAEMNHYAIANELLSGGGNTKIKTAQQLNTKEISKIQRNPDMKKLISSKGKSFNPSLVQQSAEYSVSGVDYWTEGYPEFKFNLPFDQDLLKQKKNWSTIRWIAIPLATASLAATYYFYTEANDAWSNYQNATNNDDKRTYYDKTHQLDTYTYISGGVALVSSYFIVHASFKISSINKRLKKSF